MLRGRRAGATGARALNLAYYKTRFLNESRSIRNWYKFSIATFKIRTFLVSTGQAHRRVAWQEGGGDWGDASKMPPRLFISDEEAF